jgi:hypothetical protein
LPGAAAASPVRVPGGRRTAAAFADAIQRRPRRWTQAHRRALRQGGEARIGTAGRDRSGPLGRPRGTQRRPDRARERNGAGHYRRAIQQQPAGQFRERPSQFRLDLESDPHRWSYLSGASVVLGCWVLALVGRAVWELRPPSVSSSPTAAARLHGIAGAVENGTGDRSEGQVRFSIDRGRDLTPAATSWLSRRAATSRAKQQRLPLKIESDIVRSCKQSDPERVVTGTITLCGVIG